MNDSTCIFCKIVRGELPAQKIKETENILVFKDINPKAPTHYLITPKKHIENLLFLTDTDRELSFELFAMCKELGREHPLGAFNIVINNGQKAGQIVPHLHLHFLAGTKIKAGTEGNL